jgi:hypothetical protein
MKNIWLKAVNFKESNNIAKGEGYFDLPTYKDKTQFISCWKASLLQRIKFLFFGKIYLFLEHKSQSDDMKKLFGGKDYHQPTSIAIGSPFEKNKDGAIEEIDSWVPIDSRFEILDL